MRQTVERLRTKRDLLEFPTTDCNRRAEWRWRSWMWLQFRTLNPERVVLCKRCWATAQEVTGE